MALVHEFEKRGNWLFKRRGWLPLLFLIPAILHLWSADSASTEYKLPLEISILCVGLFGQFIRAITVGRTPIGTSGRNVKGQVASELNTTGIYSSVRHPLYLGNYFMWIAPVLLLKSAWFFIIFSLIYWIYYERIMFAEEQYLRKKFGEKYDLWSENVRAFIPGFRNYTKSNLPFSMRNVLKREYHGFTNMFLVFAIVDLARNWFSVKTVMLNPLWMWTLIAAMLIWVVLRILSKGTKVLHVKGR